MVERISKRFLSLTLVAVMLLSLLPAVALPAFAATSGTLNGLSDSNIGASYTGDADNAWSASGNTITGNVISTSGTCGSTAYKTTLTLTNKKTTAATLSFDYTIAQNSGTIQVAGNAVTAGGSYSGELASGGFIEIYLKSGSTSAATSISITNLSLIADVSATTTFLPGENGSYTVDGVEITAETSKTQKSTVAYTLVATPDTGYKLLGWYSVTGGKYLSSDATAVLNFDTNQTIKPVFIDATFPIFETGGVRFYDLNEANTYAVANGHDKIVLVSDGTLLDGNYIVSAGITLVIPFDSTNAYYTTTPDYTTTASTPKAYRTLTMAPGASIAVDGAISVGAKHYTSSNANNGNPTGGYGHIKMQEGSSITLKNSSKLYAWGYISGGGHITAESGASVYEYFQIADWRGGTATNIMKDATEKVFPFSQYYVQNIEVSLTLNYGATEKVYTSITAGGFSASATVPFVGSGAMFELSEGSSFTKTYVPATDRMVFDVNGSVALNSIALSVLVISVNSNAYVLPINNNVTLNIHSGTTTVNQDVALLPGVQVSIDSGAELKVASGCSLYIYDKDQWGTYCNGGQFKSVAYSPTKTKTRTNADLVDVIIDVNGTLTAEGYIYTTASGADIKTSEGTGRVVLTGGAGTATTTYQATQSGSTITYVEIPITSAKLHNGSQYVGTAEEYTTTDGAAAGSAYRWWTSDSKWHSADDIRVSFNANGGEGSMDALTQKKDVSFTLTGNTFTRTGYDFTGWNKAKDGSGTSYNDGAAVTFTSDTVLYAQWKAKTYTVTWQNWDGTVLEKDENVPYGTTPTYDGATPTKAADAQYTYTFKGWSPDVSAVDGDVTYKAEYTKTKVTYLLRWLDYRGSIAAQYDATYGVNILTATNLYGPQNPKKPSDAQYTYTFDHWENKDTGEVITSTSTVTGNTTLVPVFTPKLRTYTITWKNDDGTVLETDENVAYGTTPEYNGATPTKAADAQYTYTFKGWSPDVDKVTKDVTYTAVYTEELRMYTVTWKNWDGTILETDEKVEYGTLPTYDGETPTKAADTQYTYTFKGWTPDVDTVTGNVTYTAVYDSTVNTYTVTWKNENGDVLETDQNVAYGTVPTYNGATPTKAADAQYTYTFKGWTPAVSEVKGNVTYTASYIRYIRYYRVTWYEADGSIRGNDPRAAYGANIWDMTELYTPTPPTKAADAQYTYTFDHWVNRETNEAITSASKVTGNTDLDPVFKQELRMYTITWKNDDGTILETDEKVAYGTVPTYDGETPAKAEETRYTYSFIGWDKDVTAVSGDVTYTAQFEKTGKNGLSVEDDGTYWLEDGEPVLNKGLVRINISMDDGIHYHYYYFGEDGKAVKDGDYKVYKNNGLPLPCYQYRFDEDGIIVHDYDTTKNGIREGDNSIFYYIDGVKVGEGLLLIDGYYYYARTSSGEIVRGRSYWVTKTNGLIDKEGEYEFDADGRMILDGFVTVNGATYYYTDGKPALGFTKIGDDYYLFNNKSGKMYSSATLWVGPNDYGIVGGMYYFGADGKMVVPDLENGQKAVVVADDGTMYFTVDGARMVSGLYELDGEYYYAHSNGALAVNESVYLDTGVLGQKGWYGFGADGKLVRNGFVEGKDGSVYYYVDGVRATGFTKIGDDYYLFNVSSGKMYSNVTLWVGSNTYGITGGMYYFDADGRMSLTD